MKTKTAEDILLVHFGKFKQSVRKIVGVIKAESDKQLKKTHASNVRRRAVKKKP